MKKSGIRSGTLLLFISMITGCQVVGGIFKAGMIWGIFLVVAIIAGIIFLISRGRK